MGRQPRPLHFGLALLVAGFGAWGATQAADQPVDAGIRLQALSVTLAAPTVSPPAGDYTGSVEVTLSHDQPGTILYYSLDGSDPTDASLRYAQPLWLAASATLKARAYRQGHHGAVATARYAITPGEPVATPTVSPLTPTKTFDGSVRVSLATATPGATIFYTLDKVDVASHAVRYTGPFWLFAQAQVRAVAFKAGMTPSEKGKLAFLVNAGLPAPAPVISPPGGNHLNSVTVVLTVPEVPPQPSPSPSPQPSPQPSPDPGGEPPEQFVAASDAEVGVLTAPMAAVDQDGASRGKVVATSVAEQGTVAITITVPAAGDYYLWGRIFADSADSDTMAVRIDDGAETVYEMADGVYQAGVRWTPVKDNGQRRVFTLAAGAHTITFRGKEPGSRLDCILLTNDRLFRPGGTGPSISALQASNEPAPAPAAPVTEIRYTLTGRAPGPIDPLYTGPFTLTAGATVMARTFMEGKAYSEVSTAVYTVTEAPTRLLVTVADRATEQPIAGATVTALRGARQVGTAATGAEGLATLTLAADVFGEEADASIGIAVHASGYADLSKRAVARRGQDTSVAVELDALSVSPHTRLDVAVKEASSRAAVAGALVTLRVEGRTLRAVTDARGRASVEWDAATPAGVPMAGIVSVRARRFATYHGDVSIAAGSAMRRQVLLRAPGADR